jgi:hypothetical protein
VVVAVVAVRHRRVPAVGAVLVGLRVATASVLRRAASWIGCRDRQRVLLNLATGGVVEVAVVQVIDVAIVDNPGMATGRPMLMRVSFVMMRHFNPLLR